MGRQYYKRCEYCDDVFKVPYTGIEPKYCSGSCRTMAYRKRTQPATNRRIGALLGAATKAAQMHVLTCKCCGQMFMRDGKSAGQTYYCSNACKQRAYRENKKMRGE